MQEFMTYLITERGYSEKTKEAYQRDLDDFSHFLENSGEASLIAVDHLDVRVYLAFLNDQKYSRNTISRKIASLRSFYHYLLKHEKIKENPFSYVHPKKKSRHDFHVFFTRRKLSFCSIVLTGQNRWINEIAHY
jgi:integrase/recombinase XerC